MNNKLILNTLSILAITGLLSGCNGNNNSSEEGCSADEPSWTQNVAPMVTREDGGEAAALVHSVDMLASGELLNQIFSANKKVTSTSAQNGLNTLSTLLTPNMSMKNSLLSGLKNTKSTTKNSLDLPPSGVPQDCTYEGTMTITYTGMDEKTIYRDYNESLTYSFDNCVEDPEVIGYIAEGIYYTLEQVFRPIPISASGISANSEGDRVTLNGEIGATFRDFDGEDSVPAWMGPASWSGPATDEPDSVDTAFLRGEITTTAFSAEFTTLDVPGSMLFESDIDLYFENRFIYDINFFEPTGGIPEIGFFSSGEYFIAGANGCLKATESDGTETHDLIALRALNLESVFYFNYDDREGFSSKNPLILEELAMMRLDGFIEASLNEGEFSFSLKADGFYRSNGYLLGPDSLNVEPRPPMSVVVMGYLGSSCLEGMLFIDGGFSESDGDTLPQYGYIDFFADVPNEPMNALGYIEFIYQDITPMITEGSYVAELYIADDLVGTYNTWSELIGENACTVALP